MAVQESGLLKEDIFGFWSHIPDDARVHPSDAGVFDRVETRFELDCLPIAFSGPLRAAPVVLLFLSPGFQEFDREHAKSEEGRAWYKSQRDGTGRLADPDTHRSAWEWWTGTVRQLGVDPAHASDKIAIFNIGAYHSKSFEDWPMLCALPSSRVALEWAQNVLFPEAEAGERVVICMRSAPYWGLGKQARYGKGLFAPAVNRRGHMLHEKEGLSLAIRKDVIEAVRTKLAEPNSN